ncbi:MAG: TIGR00180 family glycosyltransferase [Burkholderiales bacterium]
MEANSAVRAGLDELTVVIPTYNRTEHLARLLSYYASQDAPISFLVLDSGAPESVVSNRQRVEASGARFRHVVFPSSVPVATKLAEGLKLVATPYCAFCADDDLVFVEGLSAALGYLRSHPDHVCADGIYLNYRLRPGNDVQLQIEYASHGIEAAHPAARVFRLFQRYESLFYGVFRTTDLATLFAGVCRIPTLHYQELFQATAALLLGKSHRLPVFYAARQHGDPADPTRDKWQTYYWYADDRAEFFDHYCAYRNELWQFYRTHTPAPHLPEEAFVKSMDFSHTMFFGLGCPPAYLYSVLKDHWPDDTFENLQRQQNDIFQAFKPPARRWWEGRVKALTEWLQEKTAAVDRATGVNSLNREIHRRSRTPWNCWILLPELQWLSNVAEFRGAYTQLCDYLDHPRGDLR